MSSLNPFSNNILKTNIFKSINSFYDFEKRIENTKSIGGRGIENTKGDIFEIFVEALLSVNKKYIKDKVYPSFKTPIKIKDDLKLSLKKSEMGFDGVYLSDKKISTYQVKYRGNKKNTLTWRELSTFVGVSEKANYRHLFTNIDKISNEFLNKNRILITSRKDLIKLKQIEFKEIENWLYEKKEIIKRHNPEKYQEEAINNILSELKKADRATAILACGTGKTNIALWTYEKLHPKISIVFVPSIALIKQIRADWLEQTNIKNIQTLQICSFKESSAREDELQLNKDDVDFEITTNSKVIKNFIRKKNNKYKIIFSTYQSSKVLSEGAKGRPIDFAVFDEAHRTARITKRKNQELTGFNLPLYDKHIKIKKRLFVTATRRISNPSKIYNTGDPEISLSMENENLYGKICHFLSFREAARLGCIAKFKIIASFVTKKEVENKLRNKSATIVNNKEIKTDQVANQIALEKAVKKYKIKKIFTFHNTVERAKSFCSLSDEGIKEHLPDYYTNSIDGKMKLYKRENAMENFKFSKKAILSNARCLVEGVDVPSVEMVAFLDNKNSEIDIVQAAGRALRNRGINKKYGYILIPIFVEQNKGEKISDALERTNFDNIAQILKAMKEHDTEVAQIITEAVINKKSKGFKSRIKKVQELIEGTSGIISKNLLINSIINKSFSSLNTKWDEMIIELKKYKEINGNFFVKSEQNLQLYHWINNVRRRISRNELFIHQLNELREIGFDFVDPRITIFDNKNLLNLDQLSKKINVNKSFLRRLADKNILKSVGLGKMKKSGKVVDLFKEITFQQLKDLAGIDFYKEDNIYTISKLTKLTGFNLSQILNYFDKKKIKSLGRGVATGGSKKDKKIGNLVYPLVTRKQLCDFYEVSENIIDEYFTLSSMTKFVNKELNCKTSKVLLKKLIENGKIKPVGQIMKQSGRVDIFKKYKIDDLIEIAKPLAFIDTNKYLTISGLAKKINVDRTTFRKYLVKTKLLKPLVKGLTHSPQGKDNIGDYYDASFTREDFEKKIGAKIEVPTNHYIFNDYRKKLKISGNLLHKIFKLLKIKPNGKTITNRGLSDYYEFLDEKTICKKLNYDFLVISKDILTISGIVTKIKSSYKTSFSSNTVKKKIKKLNIDMFGYGPSNSSKPRTPYYKLNKNQFKSLINI